MKIIREYSSFKPKETTPINVKPLGESGMKIYFDVEKLEEIRKIIREYLITIPELGGNIYGPNRDITISGKTINSKYISLMPNNISVLVGVWHAAKRSNHYIDNADDFIFWTKNNLANLFHPSGKFFNSIYLRLDKASNLGETSELDAIPFFTNYAKENGIDVNLMKAKTTEDDAFKGIDLYFVHNGKEITIQVKTLKDIKKQIYNGEECYVVGVRSDLTEIKTDYLILMSSDPLYPSYIFRGKKNDKRIIIDNDLLKYIIPEGNLVIKK